MKQQRTEGIDEATAKWMGVIADVEARLTRARDRRSTIENDRQQVAADSEAGKKPAPGSAAKLTKDATGIDTEIESLEAALSGAQRQLAVTRQEDEETSEAASWAKCRSIAGQREKIAAKIEKRVAEIGKLFKEQAALAAEMRTTAPRGPRGSSSLLNPENQEKRLRVALRRVGIRWAVPGMDGGMLARWPSLAEGEREAHQQLLNFEEG